IVFAVVGKLGCSGAWAVGLTFAAELFPTALRSAALSVASQSGDLGGLVTPLLLMLASLRSPGDSSAGSSGGGGSGSSAGGDTGVLGRLLQRLPFAVMGLMSLAAMGLVWKLPETRGMPQLDTFEELLEWLARRSRRSSKRRGRADSHHDRLQQQSR
ncbi:hypothetical protein Agub_g6032, partial [Astrephomene gubernaculifera]